jgi:hypothetical protein
VCEIFAACRWSTAAEQLHCCIVAPPEAILRYLSLGASWATLGTVCVCVRIYSCTSLSITIPQKLHPVLVPTESVVLVKLLSALLRAALEASSGQTDGIRGLDGSSLLTCRHKRSMHGGISRRLRLRSALGIIASSMRDLRVCCVSLGPASPHGSVEVALELDSSYWPFCYQQKAFVTKIHSNHSPQLR